MSESTKKSTVENPTKRPSIATVFHLDEVLKDLGSFGKFQSQRIFIILFILYSFSIGSYNFLFSTLVPEYRCLIPECENYTHNPLEYNPNWLQNAVPYTKEKPEKCTRYEYQFRPIQNECSVDSFNANKTMACDTFVFKDQSFEGIAHDFGIYCDDKLWMLTLPSTLSFVGLLISLPFNGYFSDRFGRKRTLIALGFLSGCFAEAQAFFSYNYWMYISFQFLIGLISSGIFPISYTLLLEFIGPEYRSLGSFAIFVVGVLGETTLALIAMHVSNWRLMMKISAFPAILTILYGWVLQESIRWLIAKEKIGKANNAIKKMFEVNGVTLELEKYQKPKEKNEVLNVKQETFTDLFRSCRMTLRIATCMICWISCVFVFYGITLGSVSIFGNLYLNFIMTAFIEIPGNLAALIFSNKIGRKLTLSGSFFVAGVSCIGFAVIPGENWLKLLAFLLGKCAITSAFNCIYIYTTELYPTPFRQRVMGICSSAGRIGSIVAPQMPFLARIWTPLPYFTFAFMAITGGVLTLTFPETLNIVLPDTIENALNIGKSKEEKHDKL